MKATIDGREVELTVDVKAVAQSLNAIGVKVYVTMHHPKRKWWQRRKTTRKLASPDLIVGLMSTFPEYFLR